MAEDDKPDETPQDEQPAADEGAAPDASAAEEPAVPAEEVPAAAETPTPDEAEAAAEVPAVDEPPAAEEAPADPQAAVEEAAARDEAPPAEEAAAAEQPAPARAVAPPPDQRAEAAKGEPAAEGEAAADAVDEGGTPASRAKPEIPGADLEVDIVPEGVDPLAPADAAAAELAEAEETAAPVGEETAEPAAEAPETVPQAAIDLAAGARYRATGKRKTAVARVILRPGSGEYTVNGKPLNAHFPRATLQRNIRQPLETVGYESRMDVVATMHGGGVSAQADALRHGIARALIEADPNLRSELKRRGFLTRDPRVKERKKAGLKKARKRPQFSKR